MTTVYQYASICNIFEFFDKSFLMTPREWSMKDDVNQLQEIIINYKATRR